MSFDDRGGRQGGRFGGGSSGGAVASAVCGRGGGEGRYTGLFACLLDVVASSFGSAGSGGPFSFGLGFGVDESGGGRRGGEESLVSVTLAAGGMERRGPTESLGRVVA